MTTRFQDGSVTVGGVRLHYRDWGGDGRAVVLVHGLASTHHIWDLVAPLLARDFAVIALDQRGHGESDKPSGGYDFETVAGDLDGFLTELGIRRPVLVGHSWGGNVAVQHAASYPSVASGLCLIDGGTIEISNGMTLETARERLAPPDFTGMTMEQLRAHAREMDFGFEITPEIESIMSETFEVLADGTVRARFPRASHMSVIDAMWGHKPSMLFSRLKCPVLIMPTRSDRTDRPAEWRETAERSIAAAGELLPVSETVWLEDSVHDVPLQRPKLVADVIGERIRSGFFGHG